MQPKHVYKNPKAGEPLLKPISTKCRTPWLEVKFSTLAKPYYYSNSPTVPRYSISCVCDCDEHADFLKGIQSIEKNEKAGSLLKNEIARQDGESVTTGKVIVKFQSREKIPVYLMRSETEMEEMALEDELAVGEKVLVEYDILRYTKKNTTKEEFGLSFRAKAIYFYPSEG